MKHAIALTIAGSDSGGGAGIQADIKTFSACGVYGASVITAVTAQNLEGVRAIQAVDPQVVEAQLLAVLEGYPVKAIKTGMLFSRDIIETVAAVLSEHVRIPLVVDPVFAATSGSRLIKPRAVRVLAERLFPLAVLVTPNLPEAEFLCGRKISSLDELRQAGETLYEKYKVPFLMKGGHLPGRAVDLLVDGRGVTGVCRRHCAHRQQPRLRLHVFGGDRRLPGPRSFVARRRGRGQGFYHRQPAPAPLPAAGDAGDQSFSA